MVEAQSVWKVYQTGTLKVEALRGLDLKVRKGEMVAVMGPSGCGKTTLLNCLSGLDDITKGKVAIEGVDLATMSDDQKSGFRARRMGFIFQAYNLLPVLSAQENVELPLLLAGVSEAEAHKEGLSALKMVGLEEWRLHKPMELSGGQQQRVTIARALVNKPAIVWGDEPTAEIRSHGRSLLLGLIVFLSIIALGELYALYLNYQNNIFLRQFVSENQTRLLVQATGLLVLGLGAAYLSYLFSRAKPASRAGRYSRKVLALSPFIAGTVAFLLWFGGLGSIVGGSTIGFEVYVVIVLLLISLGMIFRDRLIFGMALRNFVRRKTSMAIVILGLMIGTAMISGSLVTQDTFTELFTRGAYYGYGFADEVVYVR